MEEILQFFANYGIAGLVAGVLFIWNFKLQDKLEVVNLKIQDKLECLNSKIIDIVEANTKAMVELRETIKDISKGN
jgi:hypothetical protein